MTQMTCDEVWMVAALAKLHHSVDKVGHVVLVSSLGQKGKVFFQDCPVVFFLNVCEFHFNYGLLFGCQIFLHIILQPS